MRKRSSRVGIASVLPVAREVFAFVERDSYLISPPTASLFRVPRLSTRPRDFQAGTTRRGPPQREARAHLVRRALGWPRVRDAVQAVPALLLECALVGGVVA